MWDHSRRFGIAAATGSQTPRVDTGPGCAQLPYQPGVSAQPAAQGRAAPAALPRARRPGHGPAPSLASAPAVISPSRPRRASSDVAAPGLPKAASQSPPSDRAELRAGGRRSTLLTRRSTGPALGRHITIMMPVPAPGYHAASRPRWRAVPLNTPDASDRHSAESDADSRMPTQARAGRANNTNRNRHPGQDAGRLVSRLCGLLALAI
jgi:hypothetical protein